MCFIKGSKKLLTLVITSFSVSFLASCKSSESAFGKLFERNVIWSDEEGRISIVVQGERTEYGFAKILINNEETKAIATFCADYDRYRYIGINLEPEESVLSRPTSTLSFGLDFKDLKDNDSAVFETGRYLQESGDPYFAHKDEIVLKKRSLTWEELDARYCINNYWCTEDRELYLYSYDQTPFTGKMEGTYKGSKIDFQFTGERDFRITEGEKRLGEGEYVPNFEGMTLLFDTYGKEEFGDRLSLVWCWANAQIASLSSK